MTYILISILFLVIVRTIFSKPYKNEIERFEDKNNWTSFGGC